jgi:hypothetical protein
MLAVLPPKLSQQDWTNASPALLDCFSGSASLREPLKQPTRALVLPQRVGIEKMSRRRGSTDFKSLDDDDEFITSNTKRTSWKRRLFQKNKQSSTKNAGPSASEKPLLLEQVLSSDDDFDGIQQVSSSAMSSQCSESSSRMSPVSELPEQRPPEPPATADVPAKQQQQQSSADLVIQGVKKNLEKQATASPPKRAPAVVSPNTGKEVKLSPTALPKTPPREKKASDEMQKVRAALSRPFGRNNLPPHMASNWAVEVSPAEWDAEEERWKYRIMVQRRTLENLDESMTTAFTWRSLTDFVWLEQALRAEYHGALLLPLLSIAIGTPDVANFTQQDVDAVLLKDWLNDVLNGIRGQGMFN